MKAILELTSKGTKQKYLVLYAGRFSEYKGVHILVESLPYLKNTCYVIAGRWKKNLSYYSKILLRAYELNVRDRVIFLGWLSVEQMDKLYNVVSVSVLLGVFYEPLSRFLLESASNGIPIIARDIGGNSEIVENGKNGILLKTNFNNDSLVYALKKVLYGGDR